MPLLSLWLSWWTAAVLAAQVGEDNKQTVYSSRGRNMACWAIRATATQAAALAAEQLIQCVAPMLTAARIAFGSPTTPPLRCGRLTQIGDGAAERGEDPLQRARVLRAPAAGQGGLGRGLEALAGAGGERGAEGGVRAGHAEGHAGHRRAGGVRVLAPQRGRRERPARCGGPRGRADRPRAVEGGAAAGEGAASAVRA